MLMQRCSLKPLAKQGIAKSLAVRHQRSYVRKQQSISEGCRIVAILVGILWLLSIATATGVTAEALPGSVGLLDGRLYTDLAVHADTLAMISLIFLALAVLFGSLHDPTNDSANSQSPWAEAIPESTGRRQVWIGGILTILVSGAISISVINVSVGQILKGAVQVQRTGFTQAALNAIDQKITPNYNPSDNGLYFFASEWAQDLGETTAATVWDADLVRSSAQIGSISNVAVGLLQYSIETKQAVPRLLARRTVKAADGHPWEQAITALLAWDQTAKLQPTLAILTAEKKVLSRPLALELTQVIQFIRKFPNPR